MRALDATGRADAACKFVNVSKPASMELTLPAKPVVSAFKMIYKVIAAAMLVASSDAFLIPTRAAVRPVAGVRRCNVPVLELKPADLAKGVKELRSLLPKAGLKECKEAVVAAEGDVAAAKAAMEAEFGADWEASEAAAAAEIAEGLAKVQEMQDAKAQKKVSDAPSVMRRVALRCDQSQDLALCSSAATVTTHSLTGEHNL